MQIAVSELVAKTPHQMHEFLTEAKTAGFEGVEMSLRPGSANPFNYQSTDADLKDFKKTADDLNLDIGSITISTDGGNLLDTGAEAEKSIDQTVWGLECAAKLGATVALHTLGRFHADLYYEDAYQNAIKSLKTIAKTAEKLQVALAVEFVWSGFLFSPLEMRHFLEAVGSPQVGFYFDPGNMAVFQFPQHWVRSLGAWTKRVHLKDWKGKALNGAWTALTEGEVDFPAVMRELRAAGYQGPLVSEVSASLAPWAETANTMRKIAAM